MNVAVTQPTARQVDGHPCTAQEQFTILVHGGTVTREGSVSDAQLELVHAVVGAARAELAAGARALDVVVAAVATLEDSGLLDAGKGSYLNKRGFVENDAAVMEGHTGEAGGVAAMQRLKNPIRAARIVMRETPHVLLAGPAGEEVLAGLGAELVADPSSYFVPYVETTQLTAAQGTVGAVALDRCGHLAAGTSTGGTRDKLPGRVGDSPIIGAGTFANEHYALSGTGVGEHFLRRCAAVDIALLAEYRGMSLHAAAERVIERLIGEIDKAAGAMIAISRDGEIVLSSNVFGVLHGYASETVDVTVGVEIR